MSPHPVLVGGVWARVRLGNKCNFTCVLLCTIHVLHFQNTVYTCTHIFGETFCSVLAHVLCISTCPLCEVVLNFSRMSLDPLLVGGVQD